LDVHREIDPASDLAAIGQLTKWLRHRKPDVIHLHSSKAGAIGRIAARMAGIPAIYSPHAIAFLRTDVGLPTRAMFFAIEWLLGIVGTVTVACSASELTAMRLIPGRKIAIPNGVNLAALSVPDLRPDQVGLNIMLCGRITAQKNPELACAVAEASPPEWRWTWLGGGDLEDFVRARGRISVTGWMPRSEAVTKLAGGDVVVHTSSWEGMPIAILEAMALGLPAIVTDAVGNRDVVEPGKTGFVCGNAEDFLRALSTLANKPALRRTMGDAARARVVETYDQTRLKQLWTALYESLALGRDRPTLGQQQKSHCRKSTR
jgi:glycosyltransferase involved in cell wall biosynthesis